MLTSVDLFSGIGGFAVALKHIAEPLLYCDVDAQCIRVLEACMKKGIIPVAPVVQDVRNIEQICSIVGKKRVDIMTAGFPCVGFSLAGKQRGLQNAQSNLFHDTMLVIGRIMPSLVLFENVAAIVSSKHVDDFTVMSSHLSRLGYTMTWTICSASEVGAPHMRRRWYGLASRHKLKSVNVPGIKSTFIDPPSLLSMNKDGLKRCQMLGNAIVPLAARLAFCRLFSGFRIKNVDELWNDNDLVFTQAQSIEKVKNASNHGYMTETMDMYKLDFTAAKNCHNVMYTIDSSHYQRIHGTGAEVKRRQISKKRSDTILTTHLPTPRTSANSPSHVMTYRTRWDLATVLRFVSKINGDCQEVRCLQYRPNPRFVEYMMGYIADHTSL
jgi:DNA-cytosine methyltransferase